jgi:hypothetical protein
VYHIVTMLSWSRYPLCQCAATLHPHSILRHPYLGVAQVLDTSKPETEPEQFIEKTWLMEAKKKNLSNLLKTKGRVLGRCFVENEAEHFVENKQH